MERVAWVNEWLCMVLADLSPIHEFGQGCGNGDSRLPKQDEAGGARRTDHEERPCGIVEKDCCSYYEHC